MSAQAPSDPKPNASGQPTSTAENSRAKSTATTEKLAMDPESLINAFKSSGEFDKLKSAVQGHFNNEEFLGALRSQVESIVRTRLQTDEVLNYMPTPHVVKDLQQSITRDGVVEQFIAEEYLAKVFGEKGQSELSAELSKTLERLFVPKLETLTEQINAALNAESSSLQTTLIPATEPSGPEGKTEEKLELGQTIEKPPPEPPIAANAKSEEP